MKWILFLLALLVVGVSGFAQKVNPQGKKLVKSIKANFEYPIYKHTYHFLYDDVGQLQTIKLGDVKHLTKTDGKIILSYDNGMNASHTYVYTLNDKNYVASVKDITRLGDNTGYGYELYEYTYDYDNEMCGDAIMGFTYATWEKFDGKEPTIMPPYEVDDEVFSYFNGEIQECCRVETTNDVIWAKTDERFIYADIINDTSINLIWLCVYQGFLVEYFDLPLLTEWCPTTAIKLPKEYVREINGQTKTVFFYEYVYEDDNLTNILINHNRLHEGINTYASFEIEYYY